MSLDDPRVRLGHMLDTAQEALGYLEGRTRADLDSNRMLFQALTRCLEIIGEAATHVPDTVRSDYPQIPWRTIVATRNRLIHGYPDVNPNIVWQTCTEELPRLTEQLRMILKR